LIEATTVLHNMLLYIGDGEREDWIDRDDASAFDEESRVTTLHNMLLDNGDESENISGGSQVLKIMMKSFGLANNGSPKARPT
jgi:hypothetical protein